MLRRFSHFMVFGLLLIVGCSQIPLAQQGAVARPNPRVKGRPRSIVCDPPRLQSLYEIAASKAGSELPWYMSRNDTQLTTFAGYRSKTADRWVNVTYDRQSASGGRLHDDYHSTTYRKTVSKTIR